MAEDWEAVTWHLWRYRHHTYQEIARFLLLEGWLIHPREIAASINERIGREFERVANPPGGAAVQADRRLSEGS